MLKKILVVGSGGREHALVWALSRSPQVGKIYVAPGNGGMLEIAENVPIDAKDINGLVRFVEEKDIDFTIVGPDDPLALGIVDAFRARGLKIFGPTQAAADIEASKPFSKRLMHKIGVPTASFATFSDPCEARIYVHEQGVPIVVKAGGLALGKGARICNTIEEAERAIHEIMVKKVHGSAGNEIVIENFLGGQEISIHAPCDGETTYLFPPAQDHKPILDGDKGENTGGMGAIAPIPWVTPEIMQRIEREIVLPTLKELTRMSRSFEGCLYPGLMMTAEGPRVLEFNARFGDPETQVYMRLLKTDLLKILEACVDGRLSEINIEWFPGFAVCVVLTSGGYPGEYKKKIRIYGVDEANKMDGVVVFHAGTTYYKGHLVTSGGRVLGVTAMADTLQGALDQVYKAVSLIKFDGMHYRKDIGAKALAYKL